MGVRVGNKQKGYNMFMRGESGADIKQYNYYHDNILLPFISATREEFDGYVPGTPVPDDMTAASWCDGNLV